MNVADAMKQDEFDWNYKTLPREVALCVVLCDLGRDEDMGQERYFQWLRDQANCMKYVYPFLNEEERALADRWFADLAEIAGQILNHRN